MPNSYQVRVMKVVKIPVTAPFVLNGTPKIVGSVVVNGQEKPVYGYREEVVDTMVTVYAKEEKDIYPLLCEKFGTDIAVDTSNTKSYDDRY